VLFYTLMAIIKEMAGKKVIDGFRGVIDFYYYMGLPIARAWPRSPGKKRSPAVMAQWAAWSYASKHWNYLSPEVRRAYEQTATGSSLNGRDLYMKAYITTYFRDGQWD